MCVTPWVASTLPRRLSALPARGMHIQAASWWKQERCCCCCGMSVHSIGQAKLVPGGPRMAAQGRQPPYNVCQQATRTNLLLRRLSLHEHWAVPAPSSPKLNREVRAHLPLDWHSHSPPPGAHSHSSLVRERERRLMASKQSRGEPRAGCGWWCRRLTSALAAGANRASHAAPRSRLRGPRARGLPRREVAPLPPAAPPAAGEHAGRGAPHRPSAEKVQVPAAPIQLGSVLIAAKKQETCHGVPRTGCGNRLAAEGSGGPARGV